MENTSDMVKLSQGYCLHSVQESDLQKSSVNTNISIGKSFIGTNEYKLKFQVKTLSIRTGLPICLSFWWKSSVLGMFLIPFNQYDWLNLTLQGENFWRNWSYSTILLTQIFSSQGQISVKEHSFPALVVLFLSFKNVVSITVNLLLHKS